VFSFKGNFLYDWINLKLQEPYPINFSYLFKDSIFFAFVTLALVISPSLSIVKVLSGGIYFPNEKLAFLILLFRGLSSEGLSFLKNRTLAPFMGLFLSFTTFILLRSLFWENTHFRDINIAVSIYSAGLIYHFFKEKTLYAREALNWNLWLQVAIGAYQLINVYFHNKEWAMIFHNHPMQEGYYFYWRVSGLFMESSQYASFLILGILYVFKQEHYSKLDYVLLALGSLIFSINRALTGYLIFLVWMLIDGRKTQLLVAFFLLLLAGDFFSFGVTKPFLISSYNKIYITFLDFQKINGEVRFFNAVNAIKEWSSGLSSVIVGVEKREIVQIGDIFSYNLYRFGLIGFIFVVAYYRLFMDKLSKTWLLILPILLTCGPIAQPVQIVYLVFLRLRVTSENSSK